MSDLDTHAQAGIAAVNEQQYEAAIASFEKAVAIAPERPDMNNALGMAHMHRGDVGGAIPYLEKAKTLSDAFPDGEHADMKVHFFTGLASAYQLTDRVADAKAVLRETVSRFPDHPDAALQLGQLLLDTTEVTEGIRLYKSLAEHPGLDDERREAAAAVAGAIEAFLDVDEPPTVFLEAHASSYKEYFDDIASNQPDWYAEAARMARGEDGEVKPILAEGARPYAMVRVDMVNPTTGEVAGVYSEAEPMVVAVDGLEPLAQLSILFPWEDPPFDTWVCSRCPWHWLPIIIQMQPSDGAAEALDDAIGSWYLAGYNGDFGDADSGRFHYIGDLEDVGNGGVATVVDLGRARFDAIPNLINRLSVLHETFPIRRLLIGGGRLPD
ncbi:MAG: tetratricopeptide (TPR) repeat protein [Myxococcota bacterium]|jgi:tetratricopeptide (TPR) repeat protein